MSPTGNRKRGFDWRRKSMYRADWDALETPRSPYLAYLHGITPLRDLLPNHILISLTYLHPLTQGRIALCSSCNSPHSEFSNFYNCCGNEHKMCIWRRQK